MTISEDDIMVFAQVMDLYFRRSHDQQYFIQCQASILRDKHSTDKDKAAACVKINGALGLTKE